MRIRLRLSILAKLTASSLILLLFLAGIGYTGYHVIEQIQTEFQNNRREELLAQTAVTIETQTYKQATAIRNAMLLGGVVYENDFNESTKTAIATIDNMIKTATTEQTRSDYQAIKAMEADYQKAAQQVFDAQKSGHADEAVNLLMNQVSPVNNKIIGAAEALTQRMNKKSSDAYDSTMALADSRRNLILWGALAAILVGLALTMISTVRMTRPILALARRAARVAEGDLTAEPLIVMDNDEVGDLTKAINVMVEHLRTLIREVHSSSQAVAGAADELSTSTAQVTSATVDVTGAIGSVAEGSATQSQSIQQALRNVTELRSAVAQIAAGAQDQAVHAQESAELVAQMSAAIERASAALESLTASAGQAMSAAQAGRTVVDKAASGMERIRETVERSAERVRELGQVSSQIGVITGTITELADQTNLLALNAAIEAARAGEHGRGFAVVADEVRKLAERSSRSAGDIARLIAGVQSGTEEAVTGMDRITLEVESGATLTQDTGRALVEIEAAVAETNQAVRTITTATTEFATYSSQVNEAVNAVAAVTEENTAATEEMAAGADQVQSAISGVAQIAEETAASAEEVSAAMEELGASTEEIAASAASLKRVAGELQNHLAQFKI